MKIAFLILAHKNPRQLQKLLKVLQHPKFDFYIHIDKKADEQSFAYIGDLYNNVYFIKRRTKIYWAAYGTIQATLNGFYEILPALKYDYINVLSAQDFPLRKADEIYAYIKQHAGTEFITCHSIEGEWQVVPRIKKYHLINWRIPGRYRLGNLLTFILPERKFPLDYEIVGRANWFMITTKAADYIINFLQKNPAVVKYFRYCWGADEFIFSTILYNSSFKENISENLTYVDWSTNKAHPKILRTEDYESLISSAKLFARKFDMEKDPVILNMLDDYITSKKKKVV